MDNRKQEQIEVEVKVKPEPNALSTSSGASNDVEKTVIPLKKIDPQGKILKERSVITKNKTAAKKNPFTINITVNDDSV